MSRNYKGLTIALNDLTTILKGVTDHNYVVVLDTIITTLWTSTIKTTICKAA